MCIRHIHFGGLVPFPLPAGSKADQATGTEEQRQEKGGQQPQVPLKHNGKLQEARAMHPVQRKPIMLAHCRPGYKLLHNHQ